MGSAQELVCSLVCAPTLILLKSSFLFLVHRHGNRDEMISYFLHHHVPPKNRTYILVEMGIPRLIPSKRCFKLLSDGGRRSMLRLYN